MRYLLNSFLLLLPLLPFAQNNPLDNPNIAWAAELYHNHWMGGDKETIIEQLPEVTEWNHLDIQHFQQRTTESDFGPYAWSVYSQWQETMLDMMFDYDKPAYKTAELTQALSEEERNQLLYRLDTVLMFDPVTFEERWSTVRTGVDYGSLIGIRTRCILYQKVGSTALKLQVLAFAPLQKTHNETTKAWEYNPVVWYPITATTKEQVNLDQDHYVVSTRSKNEVQRLDDLQIVRGDLDLLALLEARLDNRQGLYSTADLAPLQQWEYEELREGGVDTITTFNPATFEASVQTVAWPPVYLATDALCLVIRWYWLAEEQELQYEMIGYAPVHTAKDDAGNFTYYRPLVYIKN